MQGNSEGRIEQGNSESNVFRSKISFCPDRTFIEFSGDAGTIRRGLESARKTIRKAFAAGNVELRKAALPIVAKPAEPPREHRCETCQIEIPPGKPGRRCKPCREIGAEVYCRACGKRIEREQPGRHCRSCREIGAGDD